MFFTACSSDGNDEPTIYHKWFYKESIHEGVTHPYAFNGCNKEYMEFYGGNKVRIGTVYNCQEDILATGTFTKQNNVITTTTIHLTDPPYTQSYEITELTKDKLTINTYGEYYISYTGEILPLHIDKLEP